MDKRKICRVKVYFDDDLGNPVSYSCDGTFSESPNARTAGGFKNSQSWTEYHITWVEYDKEPASLHSTGMAVDVPVEKVDREQLRGKAWCTQHNMEPSECFEIHNPTAFATEGIGSDARWKEEVIQSGKDGLMRAHGLTSESLKKWFELEDRAKKPLMEEFNLDDLMGGYGNGRV